MTDQNPTQPARIFKTGATRIVEDASLSGLTGIGWLSEATLLIGTLVALALGRWPRWAFSVAVLVSIIGTPSLYLSGWVALVAILAPFSDGPGPVPALEARATPAVTPA